MQIQSKKYLLGPGERVINNCKIIRIDLSVLNRNNKKISGFLFYCPTINAEDTILYLHGNGGSKIEALPLVPLIPKFKLNVISFDFLGCGSSDP
jgi:pimeloyl-ACP methyl ester carboxylesterase